MPTNAEKDSIIAFGHVLAETHREESGRPISVVRNDGGESPPPTVSGGRSHDGVADIIQHRAPLSLVPDEDTISVDAIALAQAHCRIDALEAVVERLVKTVRDLGYREAI